MAIVIGGGGGDAPAHRKLGGYLRVVVSVPAAHALAGSIQPLAPCSLTACGAVPLAPLPDEAHATPRGSSKWRASAGGGGSSVVRQLRTLAGHRCVEVEARVLRVVTRKGEDGEVVEARAVLLVDVYLPLVAWSGWQFPRSRAPAAAAVFKHLSSNWDARNALVAFDWSSRDNAHCDDRYIWSCTDCHVFGCEVHQMSSTSSNDKSFDLHEIFKVLPSVRAEKGMQITRVIPDVVLDNVLEVGIWDIPDDLLHKVLIRLKPRDLIRVAASCHHLRTLAASIMPCMKLKLFPHQEAAIEWMLRREQNTEPLAHPLCKNFCTEDGFPFFINVTSGEIFTGIAPTINDFGGGMFCDEPGLGKTVTALSLILKTQGMLAEPPKGVDIKWCMHKPDKKYGYYEFNASNCPNRNDSLFESKRPAGKEYVKEDPSSSGLSHNGGDSVPSTRSSRKRGRLVDPGLSRVNMPVSSEKPPESCNPHIMPATQVLKFTKNLKHVRKNLMDAYNKDSAGTKRKRDTTSELSETWVQCDGCRKWRRLLDGTVLDSTTAWFCSMNADAARKTCTASEESWDFKRKITYLPGFYKKDALPGNEQNVSFFANILKDREAGQDIQETMDELMQGGLDPLSEEYQSIRYALFNGTDCVRCRDWCRLPVITPCRHLLCHDCVALDSEKCIVCGNNYEMQSPESLARPENPNPKWPVPKDLIELQPSYKQDDWDPDWQSTTSSKVAYLVEKLRSLREANVHGHSTNITNGAGLASNNLHTRLPQTLPDKVIIFSQFLEHIHVIEQQLTIAGITYAGMYSPMPLGSKRSALLKYKEDPTCMALLMDGTAALGLDLSFVNHVFLMEPIWDRSMEEQVISRAHRMGATRPINVETLAMRGTIEEQMLKLLQDSSACRKMVNKGAGGTDNEGARPHRSLHDFAEKSYLAKLGFVKGSKTN
uniref:Uncharacterized protein n=1 Tax=Avena sativa TaxID=4498 RepID=A0ACD5WMQ2_AVESA